jgi:ABC-type multidrug transport system ATPase subunit
MIEFRHMQKAFGQSVVLKDINATINEGDSIAIIGPSGTGKSTHTRLWCEHIEGTYIINDDKPAIRKVNNELFVYGTPFSGKEDLSKNEKVKLGGICLIYRNEENVIKRISAEEAIVPILRQTIHQLSEKKLDKFLKLLDDILSNVPVYKMGCNISKQAALLSYNTMKRTKDNA